MITPPAAPDLVAVDIIFLLAELAFNLCVSAAHSDASQCMVMSTVAYLMDCADSRPYTEAGRDVMVM